MSTDTAEKRARHAEYQRLWRAKNVEKWTAIAKKARKKWKQGNRSHHREAQREHRYAVRHEILTLIGGCEPRCKRCGFDADWRALQIDHINGGGRKDVRTSGGNTNLWALRNWLLANIEQARALYQVLCANCNWIKRHENDEQPNKRADA